MYLMPSSGFAPELLVSQTRVLTLTLRQRELFQDTNCHSLYFYCCMYLLVTAGLEPANPMGDGLKPPCFAACISHLGISGEHECPPDLVA